MLDCGSIFGLSRGISGTPHEKTRGSYKLCAGIYARAVSRKITSLFLQPHPRRPENRPRSIYQYSNMAPRLSGQTSIFGVVFFVSKSPLGIEGQKNLEKFAIFTRKPRSHA